MFKKHLNATLVTSYTVSSFDLKMKSENEGPRQAEDPVSDAARAENLISTKELERFATAWQNKHKSKKEKKK